VEGRVGQIKLYNRNASNNKTSPIIQEARSEEQCMNLTEKASNNKQGLPTTHPRDHHVSRAQW